MKKFILLMITVLVVSATYAQRGTDLFFSEYIEGSGNNKCVEIYNPTDQTIDLNSYFVVRYSNGSAVFTEGGQTQLVGTLEPYKTFVLVNGQVTSTSSSPACSPVLQAMADQLDGDYPAPTYMNGNDAIALLKTPNGEPISADGSNAIAVDLIGQIGMGNDISNETGWSYVMDSTLTYNINDVSVTGKVINYVVQKYATVGAPTMGPFWMSWTSNHSLIRKATVVSGVVGNPDPFIVNLEWDTVAAQVDTAGNLVYADIWDNLGSHGCVADPDYTSVVEFSAMGTLNIYPNPVVSDHFTFQSDATVKSIQIFDIVGNEVLNNKYDSYTKEAEVYLGSMIEGMYILKVTFTNNSSSSQKILIK